MKCHSNSKRIFGALVALAMLALSGMNAYQPTSDIEPRNTQWEVNIDPHRVAGVESCEKCHSKEIQVWKQTPHSETFLTLHRKPAAQQIATKMGIESFKTDSNCIQCHYTMREAGVKLEAISGVSCESCHGPAKEWLTLHNDYGGAGVTRSQESPEHRISRLTKSIKAGMRNPVNVYLVAQSCYRCHTVPDEKLVNVGGHAAGSLDFEIVSWSQGSVRHNFHRTDGKANQEESPERLRLMFVAGMIADLESSMRATSKATEKATYGVTSAKRTARAADRLKSTQSKLQLPILEDVLTVFGSVQLKLSNKEQLAEAADKINALGLKFAATVDGASLTAIDPFVPKKDKWK